MQYLHDGLFLLCVPHLSNYSHKCSALHPGVIRLPKCRSLLFPTEDMSLEALTLYSVAEPQIHWPGLAHSLKCMFLLGVRGELKRLFSLYTKEG